MDEINIKTTINNDIKTLFFIANTFTALIGGLLPMSTGTAMALEEGFTPPAAFSMVIGIPVVTFASLGYYAALKENKKMLNIYSVLAGLVVAMESLVLAAPILGYKVEAYIEKMLFAPICILHVGVTLGAMGLAVYLAKRVPSILTPTTSKSGLAHCMKYVGYGVLTIVIFGFVGKFFVVI